MLKKTCIEITYRYMNWTRKLLSNISQKITNNLDDEESLNTLSNYTKCIALLLGSILSRDSKMGQPAHLNITR